MKKNLFDNSKLQEEIQWGNIPVGNMTDEELYSKNWNLIDIKRQHFADPNFRKKHHDGILKNARENIEWLQKTIDRNKKIGKDHNRVKKISEKAKERFKDPIKHKEISEINKLRNGKKVITPIGNFDTITLAAKALGIASNTLRRYIRSKKSGYSVEEKNNHYKNTGKKITTPYGIFESKTAAAIYISDLGISNSEKKIDNYLKNNPTEYYYINKD